MLGDDPDPTVTTVRDGFGEVFGCTPEGVEGEGPMTGREIWRSNRRGTRTRLDSKRSTKAREGGRANYERMQSL